MNIFNFFRKKPSKAEIDQEIAEIKLWLLNNAGESTTQHESILAIRGNTFRVEASEKVNRLSELQETIATIEEGYIHRTYQVCDDNSLAISNLKNAHLY